MVLNRLLTGILCLVFFNGIYAQKGKHGIKTISTANNKVNEFTSLTSSAPANSTILNVANNTLNANARFTSTLTPGDLIMIIQMQGALIKLSPVPIWAPDSTYGSIYDYQLCGNYEFAEVKSVISTNQIELTCGLTHAYSSSGKTQVVRVPRYSSLTVTGTGVLTTDAWDGTIGGVLAIEVDGNTIIDGTINATGLGFRGGIAVSSGGNNFYPFSTLTSTGNGSEKGEGIGSDRITGVGHDTLGKFCKGAPGNGGGGGNANNCGGGGGGNGGNISTYNGYGIPAAGFNSIWDLEWPGRSAVLSSGGGKGGYGTSSTTTANINSVGPNDNRWGGNKRLSAGGFGGRPLDYSTGKIFMGGGGGAGQISGGQSNLANAGNGGNGGGLIYFISYGNISGAGSITSNGANGINASGTASIFNTVQGIDGAGGAGAGGTIILKSNGVISGITANALGGNGGNQNIQLYLTTTTPEAQGPGGGGSGGYIASTNAGFTQNVNGGSNGTTNASAFDTEFPMNGATSGDVGTKNQIITPSFSLTASSNQTICTNQTATLTASSTNTSASIQWYNALNTAAVSTGTIYVTPAFSTAGTYTIYAGTCPGIYRLPIVITVINGPAFSINSPTICAGQNAILTVTTTATSYTWNTTGSPTTNTLSVSPLTTTIYTISGNGGSCVGSQTVQVIVNSTPTISLTSPTICAGNTATITASGATSFTWVPGNTTGNTYTTSPVSNSVYTVTGANGNCTSIATTTVMVNSNPTLTVNSPTICQGQTATFSVSGAGSFTWNPGGITGTTFTMNPSNTTTVSVIGANGSCTTQITRTVTVNQTPTISVNSSTICLSQSALLNASGANSYTWSTGQTTSSISVSPSTITVYTVSGETNGCLSSETATVTVSSSPTISVNNATICSGNAATLTASGASTFTWMPGGQTGSSIAVSPDVTTNYSVTGANGSCTHSAVSTVSVTSTPTLAANSATICAGQTATLTVSGANTYTWSPGNVPGSTFTLSPPSDATVSVSGSNGSCISTVTLSVTIGSGISLNVNNPTICNGESALLSASGAVSYTWNSGATGSTLSVNPSSTQIYTVTGTSGSCSGMATATVSVVNTPTVSVSDIILCSGNSGTMSATGALSYTWMPGSVISNSVTVSPTSTEIYTITGSNGTCSHSVMATASIMASPTLTANSVTVCSGQTATLTATGASSFTWNPGSLIGSTFTLSPTTNAIYTVTGSNGNCVSASLTVSVNIATSPTLTVTALNITGCAPLCVNFTDLTSNSCSTISYNFGDGTNGATNNPTHCYTSGGQYSVTATCTSTAGCTSSYTLPGMIQVDQSPNANFDIPEGDVVTVGTSINLSNTSTNATTFDWTLCNSVSSLTNVTTVLVDTGSCCIQLTAINNIGCRDSLVKCVKVVQEAVVVIPNVFTPNGDQSNDYFRIKSMGLKNLQCTIFDRWGLKMHEWDDLNGYWDGSTSSGIAPDGTYFYIINYTDQQDQTTTEKGFLNLFRE